MDDNNILDSGEPSTEPYKPLHEKLPEECAENAAASPVYDDFMYEPIGFEELEKNYTEEKKENPQLAAFEHADGTVRITV